MKTAKHVILLACLAGLGLLSAPTPLHAQPAAEQVERVLGEWQKRQERISRIRYVVKGESITPKGAFTDHMGRPMVPPQPDKDTAQRQDTIFLIDIPKKRFRMELDGEVYSIADKRLVPRRTTTVFDGNSTYGETEHDAKVKATEGREQWAPDVGISKNDAAYRPLNAVNAYWLSPLLFAHGFIPQLAAGPSFLDKLDVDDFSVHGQAIHDGKPCLVLRTFPVPGGQVKLFDEYWVDLARDCAVVRHSSYMDGKLLTDLEVTYQQTSHGWLPQRWVGTTRNYTNGQLINVTRLRVQEFAIEPEVTDTDFRIEIKPGMVILEDDFAAPKAEQDTLGKKRKFYRVAPDGKWLEIGQSSGSPSVSLWRRWLIPAGIVAVLVLGFLLVRRWKAGPGRRSPAPAH
jgi:hypothetical protein